MRLRTMILKYLNNSFIWLKKKYYLLLLRIILYYGLKNKYFY